VAWLGVTLPTDHGRRGEPAAPLEVKIPPDAPEVPTPAGGPGTVTPFVSMRCGPYELKERRAADTIIGELRTPPDTVEATFVYGRTADSDISVGMRFASGTAWSASGEHHVSNSHSSAVDAFAEPHSAEDLILRSSFDYGRFTRTCHDVYSEQVRGLGWNGHTMLPEPDIDISCTNANPDFVGRQGRNTGFTRDDKRAAGWSGAANVFGFGFAARSGYSRHVQSRWRFGQGPMHLICGNDDRPENSTRIFAGQAAISTPPCRVGRPC